MNPRPDGGARPGAGRVALEAAPLTLAVLALLVWGLAGPGGLADARKRVESEPMVELQRLAPDSAAELSALLERSDYGWPPEQVPPLAVTRLPADLEAQEVAEKKRLFLQTLLPLVLAENRAVAAERRFVARALEDWPLAEGERLERLQRLADEYRVEGDLADAATRRRLLRRVDQVPPALALAQAAIETGWGTSRFAREGNNLFGQWTYQASQGLLPEDRVEGASHFVRRFPDLRASVRGYLRNLTTHRAYRPLRLLREHMRRMGRPLDAATLAGGLEAYSERGQEYVNDVRNLIRQNQLQRLAAVSLREAG